MNYEERRKRDHDFLKDKKYTTLQKLYTLQVAKRCGKDIEIRWSDRYKNWRIYWRGKRIGELLTGEKFNLNKVANIVKNVRNERAKELMKQYQTGREYNERKAREEEKDRGKCMAKEIYNYADVSLIVTNTETGEKTILNPQKKKHFMVNKK